MRVPRPPHTLMLDDSISWSVYNRTLQQYGLVNIPNVLLPARAEELYRVMRDSTPYRLAYRLNGQDLEAEPDPVAELGLQKALAQANERFTYAYDGYHLVKAYLANDQRAPSLRTLLEYFNSPAFLNAARRLTGDPAIRRVDAQATRYRPGHFLRTHNDVMETERRRFAYVLYLTRDWHSDFGGLLAVTDANDDVQVALKPGFNHMLVFKVPQLHHVTAVSAIANVPRLAISGWFTH